jgi:hypothetical protein
MTEKNGRTEQSAGGCSVPLLETLKSNELVIAAVATHGTNLHLLQRVGRVPLAGKSAEPTAPKGVAEPAAVTAGTAGLRVLVPQAQQRWGHTWLSRSGAGFGLRRLHAQRKGGLRG